MDCLCATGCPAARHRARGDSKIGSQARRLERGSSGSTPLRPPLWPWPTSQRWTGKGGNALASRPTGILQTTTGSFPARCAQRSPAGQVGRCVPTLPRATRQSVGQRRRCCVGPSRPSAAGAPVGGGREVAPTKRRPSMPPPQRCPFTNVKTANRCVRTETITINDLVDIHF